jgi:hypothetical protein
VKALSASLFAPGIIPTFLSPHVPAFSHSFVGAHEFDYGVSIVPLLFILAAILFYLRKPSRPHHVFVWMVLALVLALPIALTIGNAVWGRTLLKIPIINNNTTFIRWWSIYITPLIVAAGLSFDRVVPDTRIRDVVLGGSILVVVTQLMSRDLSYYQTSNETFSLYDPAPVISAVGRVSAGMSLPEISQVGAPPPDQSKLAVKSNNSDGLIWGISEYPCYEPIFGYYGDSGELFPAHQLKVGPVESQNNGHFNLVDPRCYLSVDGTCHAGALFRREEKSDVAKFTSHRPLPWQHPLWQSLAEVATVIAVCVSVLSTLVLGVIAGGGAITSRDRGHA